MIPTPVGCPTQSQPLAAGFMLAARGRAGTALAAWLAAVACLLVAVAAGLAIAFLCALASSQPFANHPPPAGPPPSRLPQTLQALARRVQGCPPSWQPAWKRAALARILVGKADRRTVRVTCYAAGHPEIDPPCGNTYRDFTGRWVSPLKRGHVAADPRHYPAGTVIYLGPPFEQFVRVGDTGGAVKGPSHLDFNCCEPGDTDAQARARFPATEALPGRERVTCWVCGRRS